MTSQRIRSMLWLGIASALAFASTAPGAPATVAHPSVKLKVTPRVGRARTRFVVTFRASEEATGDYYSASAQIPGRRRCSGVSDSRQPKAVVHKGQRVKIAIDPAREGGTPCRGRYRVVVSFNYDGCSHINDSHCGYFDESFVVGRGSFRIR